MEGEARRGEPLWFLSGPSGTAPSGQIPSLLGNTAPSGKAALCPALLFPQCNGCRQKVLETRAPVEVAGLGARFPRAFPPLRPGHAGLAGSPAQPRRGTACAGFGRPGSPPRSGGGGVGWKLGHVPVRGAPWPAPGEAGAAGAEPCGWPGARGRRLLRGGSARPGRGGGRLKGPGGAQRKALPAAPRVRVSLCWACRKKEENKNNNTAVGRYRLPSTCISQRACCNNFSCSLA